MKRVVLIVLLLITSINAKWYTVSDLAEKTGNKEFLNLSELTNTGWKQKFVAEIYSVELTDSNNMTGYLKGRIIYKTDISPYDCGEMVIFKYNQDVKDWDGSRSILLRRCY